MDEEKHRDGEENPPASPLPWSSSSSFALPPSSSCTAQSEEKAAVSLKFQTKTPVLAALSSMGDVAAASTTFAFGECASSTESTAPPRTPQDFSCSRNQRPSARRRHRQNRHRKDSPSTFLFLPDTTLAAPTVAANIHSPLPPPTLPPRKEEHLTDTIHDRQMSPFKGLPVAALKTALFQNLYGLWQTKNRVCCIKKMTSSTNKARSPQAEKAERHTVKSSNARGNATITPPPSAKAEIYTIKSSNPMADEPITPPPSFFPLSLEIVRYFLFERDKQKKRAKGSTATPRDFASSRDCLGRTPLHIACYHGADVQAIRLLLEVYPEAAYQKDRNNRIPLQMFFYGKVWVRLPLIETLLQAHPAGAFQDAIFVSFAAATNRKTLEQGFESKSAAFTVGTSMGERTLLLGATATTPRTATSSDENDAKDDEGKSRNREAETSEAKVDDDEGRSRNREAETSEAKVERTRNAGDEIKGGNNRMRKGDDNGGDDKIDTKEGEAGKETDHTEKNDDVNPRPDGERLGAHDSPVGKGTLLQPFHVANAKDVVADSLHVEMHSITAMSAFRLKSFEELRFEDYAAGNRGWAGQPKVPFSVFGSIEDYILSENKKISTEKGSTVSECSKNKVLFGGKKMSLLHLAASRCAFCEPGVLEAILRTNPTAALEVDRNGNTPLHILLAPMLPLSASTDMTDVKMKLMRAMLGKRREDDDDQADGASLALVDPKEVAAIPDTNGRTALHLAVNHGVDEEAVQLLLDAYPQAAAMQDASGDTPLHMVFRGLATSNRIALENHEVVIRKKLVDAILTACPDAAKVGAKDHQTPLHLAYSRLNNCEDGVFESVLDAHPQAIFQFGNNQGKTMLHSLITELRLPSADVSKLMKLIRLLLGRDGKNEATDNVSNCLHPRELAAKADFNGHQPLHLAVQQLVREELAEVIRFLLDIYPEAASHEDKQGNLPIQLLLLTALQCPLNRKVRNFGTVGTDIKMEKQNLPSNVIMALLKANPLAATEEVAYSTAYGRITRKQTLLHLVAMQAGNHSVEVFDAIQMANPSAALRPDSLGRTPLHCLISDWLAAVLKTAAWETHLQFEAVEKIKILLRPAKTKVIKQVDGISDTQTWTKVTTAAAAKDHKGETPLHLIAGLDPPCPPEIIATLLDACPAAASSRDNQDRLPLSVASDKLPTTATLLKELIRAYPAALLKISGNNLRRLLSGRWKVDEMIPLDTLEEVAKAYKDADATSESLLHIIAENAIHCSVKIFDVIERSNPSAVLSANCKGETPLHSLIRNTPDLSSEMQDKMKVLLRTAAATAAALRDREGMTPLHTLLCDHESCSREMAVCLLEAWPDAASIQDRLGRFPLTVALTRANRPIPYLKDLLDAYPAAIMETDLDETTCLHHLLGQVCDVDDLKPFLEAHPEAATKLDRSGVTPLQKALLSWLASSHAEHIDVVEFMAQNFPDSITARNSRNKSTLHIAVGRGVPAAIIEILVKVDPEAAGELWDDDISTPLSTAVCRYDAADVCKILLSHCPLSARTILNDNTTALHHVQSVETMKMLLNAWPEALLHKSRKRGQTPMHYWIMENVFSDDDDDEEEDDDDDISPLQHVKHHAKQFFIEAVMATDNLGLTPLHYVLGEYSVGGCLIGDSVQSALEDPDLVVLLRAYPEALFLRVTGTEETKGGDDVGANNTGEKADHNDVDGDSLADSDNKGGREDDNNGDDDDDNDDDDENDDDNDDDDENDDDDDGSDDDSSDDGGDNDGEDDSDGDEDSSEGYIPLEGIVGSSLIEKLCELDKEPRNLELVFDKLASATSDGPVSKDNCSPARGRDLSQRNVESQVDGDEKGRDRLAVWFLRNACEHVNGSSAIARLVRKCHDCDDNCVRCASEAGDLPLHIACHHAGCSLELVTELTELYGAALTMEGSAGQVPFLLACLNGASVDVIYHLLRSAPDIIFG